jgi:hypothetical protein
MPTGLWSKVNQMRKFVAFAFAALVAAMVMAPLAVGSEVVEVSGTVTGSEDGAPVVGAKVTLSYWSDAVYADREGAGETSAEYTAATGADGTFSMSVAPGSYGVYVEAQGYERWYGSMDTDYESEITISLAEVPPYDAELTLVVKDSETGVGIGGASVYGWPDFTYGGEAGVLGFPSYQEIYGVTDAQGEFATGIWNGAYTVSVSAEDYFYASASLVVSGADVTSVVELAPVPAPNSTLSGTVVDQSTGAPISGAEIWVYPDYSYIGNCWGGYASPEAVYADAAGQYSAQVYGGANSISICADDYYSYWGSVNVPDNFAMTFDAALFPVVEPETVSVLGGTVADGDGAGIAGATVQVTYWPSTYCYDYLGTETADGSPAEATNPVTADLSGGSGYDSYSYYGQPWYYETMAGAGGAYSLAVPVGELSVSVWSEGYYAYYGWTSVSQEGTFWLNATLSPVPEPDATIEGAVTDATTGEPIEGAYVSAYLARDPVAMYDMAVEEGEIATGVGGTDSATAPAIAPDAIGYYDPYGYYYSEAATDENGKFSLDVPHGEQAISVWADGYAYYSTTLSLAEGDTLVVELSLGRSADDGALAGADESGKQFVMAMGDDMNYLPSVGDVEKVSIAPGGSREISMDDVFQGADGLTFSYEAPDNLQVSYDEERGTLRVTAPGDWTGEEDLTLKATDGTATVYKTLSVSVAPQSSMMVFAGFAAAIAIAAVIVAAIWKTQKE